MESNFKIHTWTYLKKKLLGCSNVAVITLDYGGKQFSVSLQILQINAEVVEVHKFNTQKCK